MRWEEFQTEKMWLGWRAMAVAVFNLRPVEADALLRLARNAGRPVTFETFAGDLGNRNGTGTREGVKKRIERVRAKLADIGCDDVIATVERGGGPALGYRLAPSGLERINRAMWFVWGVEGAAAAA